MAAVAAAVAAVKFLALVQILVRPVWTFLAALFFLLLPNWIYWICWSLHRCKWVCIWIRTMQPDLYQYTGQLYMFMWRRLSISLWWKMLHWWRILPIWIECWWLSCSKIWWWKFFYYLSPSTVSFLWKIGIHILCEHQWSSLLPVPLHPVFSSEISTVLYSTDCPFLGWCEH